MSNQEEKQVFDSRIELALFLAIIALGLSVVHFFAGAWHSEHASQRLHRIENIVGIDEIGRKK